MIKKKVEIGQYTFTHERYIDEDGMEYDDFEIFDREERVHYPFMPQFTVVDQGNDFPINRISYDYTEKDYKEMLQEQLEKIEKSKL